jgi:hypothetical protein
VVCTTEGEPIRDSFQNLDRSLAQAYATLAADLARQAAGLFAPVKTWAVAAGASAEGGKGASRKKSNVSPPSLPISESTVEMIRVRTLLHEIIVRCSEEFILVVVQEPVD